MKFSKLLLFGIAATALITVANRLKPETPSFAEDDLDFDADFIPGSKKLNLDIPDHVDPSWFRAPQRFTEDTDAMFI
ncbi:hypothetical protein [Flavobacterium caeni]|uniref:Uncharacterized protein n=1 Tax=Flavobacterium caeni TaxID=490189 RepID=A0A1G5IYS0_9FLAO|nr:hypothetical protein [Flavobacterium caeni]SCY80860.1 hypothetical protein SAMN02927903_02460 [Flavobacterium caeni]